MQPRAPRCALLSALLLFIGCGPSTSSAPPAPAAPSLPAPAPGWGAVFHRDGAAYAVGGGDTLVGPRGLAPGVFGAVGPCGGRLVSAGPEHPVVALPAGLAAGDAPEKPPANPAPTVEAAAWRVDEALPEADRFTPRSAEAAQPARQRGVALGSVVKVRRYGGPPLLVASGTRDCNGVLAILDSKAERLLGSLPVPGACAMGRVLPPADLDGDGQLETAYFSDDTVLLARLQLDGPTPTLEPLGGWRCAP